jgi:hypothetical protein
MNCLRRAWAVLRGRNDPEMAALKLMLAAAENATRRADAEAASLRASLDDARADAKRYAAERAGLERVLRTILEAADHGLANPTENGR